jgi:putative zinc finger/helix-turn-helix YgiT family protein
MIQCFECRQGHYTEQIVENRDLSAFVGLDQVVLGRGPALVCDRCGNITFDGALLERVMASLARMIVTQSERLRPQEVRFLRKELDWTQAELAERLDLDRATIRRWETGETPVGRGESFVLRSLVAWHLQDANLAREIAVQKPRATSGPALPYRVDALSDTARA